MATALNNRNQCSSQSLQPTVSYNQRSEGPHRSATPSILENRAIPLRDDHYRAVLGHQFGVRRSTAADVYAAEPTAG